MNLNEIIQAAQGGEGVNNLASQFGLSPEQTQAAIQAIIPAFSDGLQVRRRIPGSRRDGCASDERHASRFLHDPNQAMRRPGSAAKS